jgi:hypothetical protein
LAFSSVPQLSAQCTEVIQVAPPLLVEIASDTSVPALHHHAEK